MAALKINLLIEKSGGMNNMAIKGLLNLNYQKFEDVLVDNNINSDIVKRLKESEKEKKKEVTANCKEVNEILNKFANTDNRLKNMESAYYELQSKTDIQVIINNAKKRLKGGYNNKFIEKVEDYELSLKELQEETFNLLKHMQYISHCMDTDTAIKDEENLKKHFRECERMFEYLTLYTSKLIVESLNE